MMIYISLVCPTPIILLDETLGELSTEETEKVPEGWLCRVLNTLIEWSERKNKIIILVGHGMISSIPNDKTIVKLCLKNTLEKTILSEF